MWSAKVEERLQNSERIVSFSMLSTVVGTVALLPATIAYITRKQVPLPVTLILAHIAATGFAVALAASDRFATKSTYLLGKNSKTGYIAYWAWPLFWPYHLSLQAKLWIQRQTRTEAVWNRVDEGWCVHVSAHDP